MNRIEYMNIRIYLSVRKIADDYYEAKYKDYLPDGTQVGFGYEDFSGERLREQTKKYAVYTYNGRVMHGTREGWRMTDCSGTIRVSKKNSGLAAAKIQYKDVARVRLM